MTHLAQLFLMLFPIILCFFVFVIAFILVRSDYSFCLRFLPAFFSYFVSCQYS